MTTVTLPWPPKELSPNARVHWAVKARITKKYKEACWRELICERKGLYRREYFKFTFRPPDKRRRDRDNCIASCKALQDALSIATGVNDLHLEIKYAFGDPIKGGAVIVEVTG